MPSDGPQIIKGVSQGTWDVLSPRAARSMFSSYRVIRHLVGPNVDVFYLLDHTWYVTSPGRRPPFEYFFRWRAPAR